MVLPLKSAELQGLTVIEFKPTQVKMGLLILEMRYTHHDRSMHIIASTRVEALGNPQPQFQRGKNITQINSSTAVFLANILKHMCLLQIADSRFRLNQSHF